MMTLLVSLTPIFLSLLEKSYPEPKEYIVLLIDFIVSVILITFSLIYQYILNIQGRKHIFSMLSKIGYTRKELLCFATLLWILASPFTIIMFVRLYLHNPIISINIALTSLAYIALILIVGIIY